MDEERIENSQISLEDILRNAVDLTESRSSYINHIQFNIGATEVVMDLFTVGPNPKEPGKPQAQRIHRVIMPIGLAKNIAQLLLNGVMEWEGMFGVTLPLVPQTEHEDVSKTGITDSDE